MLLVSSLSASRVVRCHGRYLLVVALGDAKSTIQGQKWSSILKGLIR